jgi:hypothetical protein
MVPGGGTMWWGRNNNRLLALAQFKLQVGGPKFMNSFQFSEPIPMHGVLPRAFGKIEEDTRFLVGSFAEMLAE